MSDQLRRPKRLTKGQVGERITCTIEDELIEDAKIQFQDGRYYICQDVKRGSSCNNMLGYRCSWVVGDGSLASISKNNVDNIRVSGILGPIQERGDVIAGDHLLAPGSTVKVEVLGICGSIIFLSGGDEEITPHSEDSLIKAKYSICGEE